jgi:hypothetical protein
VPLAPPRTLPGFIDTMTRYGHKDWWGSAASVPKGLGWFTNHYLFASVAGLVVLLTGFAPSRAAFRLGWLKPPPSLIGA